MNKELSAIIMLLIIFGTLTGILYFITQSESILFIIRIAVYLFMFIIIGYFLKGVYYE